MTWESKNAKGAVGVGIVLVGTSFIMVPISCNVDGLENVAQSSTLEILDMWFRWLQMRRGPRDFLIPKELVEIRKVQIPLDSGCEA